MGWYCDLPVSTLVCRWNGTCLEWDKAVHQIIVLFLLYQSHLPSLPPSPCRRPPRSCAPRILSSPLSCQGAPSNLSRSALVPSSQTHPLGPLSAPLSYLPVDILVGPLFLQASSCKLSNRKTWLFLLSTWNSSGGPHYLQEHGVSKYGVVLEKYFKRCGSRNTGLPKRSMFQVSKLVMMWRYGANGTLQMWLTMSGWEDFLGLACWVLCNPKGPSKGKKEAWVDGSKPVSDVGVTSQGMLVASRRWKSKEQVLPWKF